MAASRVTKELTALLETRSRLEAALGSDEHWRALQQSAGRDGGAEESAARRARNTRLKMALAENPLYQAWKHVGEAIDALHKSGGGAEDAADASATATPALRDAPRPRIGTLAARLAAGAALAAEVRPSEPEPAGGRPPTTPPTLPRVPLGAMVGERERVPGPRAPRRADLEPDEATVTFVRREPLSPPAQLPADNGTERSSGFEGEPGLPEETFAPPRAGSEEADVVIVTAESAGARRTAEEQADTLRRVRKALSGE